MCKAPNAASSSSEGVVSSPKKATKDVDTNDTTAKKTTSDASLCSLTSIFWTKEAYEHIADEFHQFHQHDWNVFLHFWTTGLGVWGVVQLAVLMEYAELIYAYMALIVLTCPNAATCVVHTLMVIGFTHISLPSWVMSMTTAVLSGVSSLLSQTDSVSCDSLTEFLSVEEWNCLVAVAIGYGLQDVAHYLCVEKTYLNDYILTRPYMLLIHSLWLLPLVIDAMSMRVWFLSNVVYTNRNVVCNVKSREAVNQLRTWLQDNIRETPVTTHVWPHKQSGTSKQVTQLENDENILKQFRTVFAEKHYDILPVQDMNEIYVTAVGAKKEINSDAVFYTKHNDGPYWWIPFCSLYRVLVGVTPNTMVRTNFNLQHPSENQVMDMYGVVGFDYNRELHFIDHVPGETNKERRSLIKLHFIVYPRGWHRLGKFAMQCNTNYNTWARNNFLQTLTCDSMYDWVLAWWIWLTTIINATLEEFVGWPNVVYVGTAYVLGQLLENKPGYASTTFFIMTSYRHYIQYITTFAFRTPKVAHGYFMRDALLYKTLALIQLGVILLPLVDLTATKDLLAVGLAVAGYSITILATARLGKSRTYFGYELGYEEPKWITGFPYGYIPHPMIVGQLIAFSGIIYGLGPKMDEFAQMAIAGHMAFYTTHMIQEILTSSYYQ